MKCFSGSEAIRLRTVIGESFGYGTVICSTKSMPMQYIKLQHCYEFMFHVKNAYRIPFKEVNEFRFIQ